MHTSDLYLACACLERLGLLDLTFNLPPYSRTYRRMIESALKP